MIGVSWSTQTPPPSKHETPRRIRLRGVSATPHRKYTRVSSPHVTTVDAATAAKANGWQALKLTGGTKFPPPSGYTGRAGKTDSFDIRPGSNWGIRMPIGVAALDVDHGYPCTNTGRVKHGGVTLAGLVDRLGPLPATWTLSSRTDRTSCQSFYRIPAMELLGEIPGRYGPDGVTSDVEIIQFHHRYAVGPGSVVEGRTYVLFDPNGVEVDTLPVAGDLPELPASWVQFLADTQPDPDPVQPGSGEQPRTARPRSYDREPTRRLTFAAAATEHARQLDAYRSTRTPGYNATTFKFLAISRAFWTAQGHTEDEWKTTAGRELLTHPYFTDGTWQFLNSADRRRVDEVGAAARISWELIDDRDQAGVYVVDREWDCGASSRDPQRVAKEWLALTHFRLHFWRDNFYRYSNTEGRWKRVEHARMQAILWKDLGYAFYMRKERDGTFQPARFQPTDAKVTDVRKALEAIVLRRSNWVLDKAVVFDNGALDLRTGVLSDHSPTIFNVHKINADYDPDALCPDWETFIASSLPDADQQEVLQEMFGYLMSGRQDLHKIFGMWGEKRSGKSTIARVLGKIMGSEAVSATTFSALIGTFGLQNHTESSVIVVNEARVTRETKNAVDLLLAISGCDQVPINIKHKSMYSATIPGRLVMISNMMPNVMDDSDAFASRFVHIMFNVSFYGREDHSLDDRLAAELPGIVAWGLRGLARLNENKGRFTKSTRHIVADRQLGLSVANVPAWFGERVEVTGDPDDQVSAADLRFDYETWCRDNDVEEHHVATVTRQGTWLSVRLGGPAKAVKTQGFVSKVRCGIRMR